MPDADAPFHPAMPDPAMPDPEETDALASVFPAATHEQWLKLVNGVLKGGDFTRRLVARTADGIAIQPLYAKADGAAVAGARPGARWRIEVRVDHPEPLKAAELARAELEGGADALALVFPPARAARGAGVRIDTLNDLDDALDGVLIDLVALRLEPAPGGRVNAGLLAALAARRGHDPAAMSIAFGLDPIGVLGWTGGFAAPWEAIGARLTQTVSTLTERGFRGPFISVDARGVHEAGGSDAQELAYALACTVAYLRALEAGGLPLNQARAALSFTLAIDADQFLSIAKLRALRRLMARIDMACGLEPTPILIHAETAWRMMTRRDPWVNLLRGTLAAFSAGVGGADSVAVQPFTAALGLPDAFARRVARNTQHVLLEEAHLWRVADPAAGAGGYEALTDALCDTAWTLFQAIEAEGGLVESLKAGALQGRIARVRQAREAAVATRRAAITGVSEFAHLAEAPVAVLEMAPAPAAAVRARLGGPKRDFAGMIAALTDGASRHMLVPLAREGLHCEPLPQGRDAAPFEALRDAADAQLARTGARPRVFLACVGPLASHAGRAAFARNLFEAGGFQVIAPDADDSPADAALLAQTLAPSGATLACLCGADEDYATLAQPVADALRNAGARAVWLAGKPGLDGIDSFIHAGCDALAALQQAQAISA